MNEFSRDFLHSLHVNSETIPRILHDHIFLRRTMKGSTIFHKGIWDWVTTQPGKVFELSMLVFWTIKPLVSTYSFPRNYNPGNQHRHLGRRENFKFLLTDSSFLGHSVRYFTNVLRNFFPLTSTVIHNVCEVSSLAVLPTEGYRTTALFCMGAVRPTDWPSQALTEWFPDTRIKETSAFISLELHFIISLEAARQPYQLLNVNNSSSIHSYCSLYCGRCSWMVKEFARFQPKSVHLKIYALENRNRPAENVEHASFFVHILCEILVMRDTCCFLNVPHVFLINTCVYLRFTRLCSL
jgi:hypothetical protein